ncbi:MAG: type II toxin-antitoxin system VapC family toxin [Euryarchaeota archaeon]|nr:type II toxin-antitoxin system VapC family toxin [Euryarchaeota archaeon]
MIFVDSSYFIAMANREDRWHGGAKRLTPRLEREDLVTSDLVLAEAVTGVGALLGGKAGKETYDVIVDNCSIEVASPERCGSAITMYLHYDGTLSFADAVSLVVMQEFGAQRIASFDADFDRVRGIERLA